MSTDARPAAANAGIDAPPPLENGDRLTRAEFLRRYWATPNVNKAELIEGVVFMPSPVSTTFHGSPHVKLSFWLASYEMWTPGLVSADNATVLLDGDNSFQPDLFLAIPPGLGGKTTTIDNLTAGPPELVAEVASSSTSRDLHSKLNVYRRNGVQEYLVWRTRDQEVDWFVLQEGDYVPLPPKKGVLESRCFPGLRLDVPALLAGKLAKLQATLQAGCRTAKHAAFAAKLAAAAKGTA